MIVLFRKLDELKQPEIEAAEKHFPITFSRCDLAGQKVVVGRYSVLPFYQELEEDLYLQGVRLINSYVEHQYVAGFDWYHDLVGDTPQTWFQLDKVDRSKAPYVLKGRTNSRKHLWREMMYAKDFPQAVQVHINLMNDVLISPQGVVVRQFEKFKTYDTSLSGVPITNEWRVFLYKDRVLAYGYYWASHEEHAEKGRAAFESKGMELVCRVKKLLMDNVSFYVLDVAEREDGVWRVIEVNDGQMSGLSMVDPQLLYKRLKEACCGG